MTKPDLEQNLRQAPPPFKRFRRITIEGVGLNPETGAWRFRDEVGGPIKSIKLSREQLGAYERKPPEYVDELYDFFRNGGYSDAEAKRFLGMV